jgi:hypothetical protein
VDRTVRLKRIAATSSCWRAGRRDRIPAPERVDAVRPTQTVIDSARPSSSGGSRAQPPQPRRYVGPPMAGTENAGRTRLWGSVQRKTCCSGPRVEAPDACRPRGALHAWGSSSSSCVGPARRQPPTCRTSHTSRPMRSSCGADRGESRLRRARLAGGGFAFRPLDKSSPERWVPSSAEPRSSVKAIDASRAARGFRQALAEDDSPSSTRSSARPTRIRDML